MHVFLNKLKTFNSKLQKIINKLLIISFIIMVVLIFAQVIFRYFLKYPLSWSEELSRYVFSVLIFFGAAVSFREKKHINMDGLVNLIKYKNIKKILDLFSNLASLFLVFLFTYYGYIFAFQTLKFDSNAVSMPWLKMGYVFLIVPVSSTMSLFFIVEIIISLFIKPDIKSNKNVSDFDKNTVGGER